MKYTLEQLLPNIALSRIGLEAAMEMLSHCPRGVTICVGPDLMFRVQELLATNTGQDYSRGVGYVVLDTLGPNQWFLVGATGIVVGEH